LVFVKELARQARESASGARGSRPISARDSAATWERTRYYRELTQRIVGWAIEAYYDGLTDD
jgi:hypothetical protein